VYAVPGGGLQATDIRATQVDGSKNILRKHLPDVLKDILGREARIEEFDVFFTCEPTFCSLFVHT
jgi:hypothetical protein